MKKISYILIIIAFIIGFILAFLIHTRNIPGKTIIKTISEPGKMVYIKGPQPTPITIEKIVIKDGQVSFKEDLPYVGKKIVSNDATMEFNGVYHLGMIDNKLFVNDEIVGNVKTTFKYKDNNSLDDLGIFFSTKDGTGIYYRRYFNKILFIEPSIEANVSKNFITNTPVQVDLRMNFPIK